MLGGSVGGHLIGRLITFCVLFRFIVDMLAPVGGFHFVDAAPVPGRQ